MNAIELNHACTYATSEEIYWLGNWAKEKTELRPNVFMIGAGPGVMAFALLESNPNISMGIVDHTSIEYVKAHLRQLVVQLNRGLDVIYYTEDSADLGNKIGNIEVDLLIVDGDHSYEGVKRDLDAWLKHVKPNGLVFLHDYDAEGTCFAGVERYPGVRQAVEECSAHWEEYARVGTAIVMKVLA